MDDPDDSNQNINNSNNSKPTKQKEIKLCLVCNGDCDKPLTSTLAETFSKNVNAFHENNLLDADLIHLLIDGKDKLESELKNGSYHIHKNCLDKFNPSKLNRLLNTKKRKISPNVNTRSNCPNNSQFTEVCMYCEEPGHEDLKHSDRSRPLHAAAGKKKASGYVEQFTAEIHQMAVILEDSRMINLLDQDVRSSELFYHLQCHTLYKRKYENKIMGDRTDNAAMDQYIVLCALADYIDSSNDDMFDIHDLKKVYIKHFAERGKVVQPQITRFADLLKESNVGVTVVQECTGGKYKLYRTAKMGSIISDNEWLKLLQKVSLRFMMK